MSLNEPNLPPPLTPQPVHHSLIARLRNYFLTGLILVGPIYITVNLTWWLINWVDDAMRPFIPMWLRTEAYLPFRVPRGELGPFLKAYSQIPISGYSVTIPHKEAAAKLAAEKNSAVETMGAANTLIPGADGFIAYNTDAQAALESLQANLPVSQDGFVSSR